MAQTFELTAGEAVATVDLDGGKLASMRVGDLELLVTDGTKSSRWGSFPMVPWCGRLAHGKLAWEGTVHQLPVTSPPHANHGRGYLQPWTRVDDTTIRTDLGEPWPFGGHVIQRFEIVERALTITLEVHADSRAFPAMVGWHPWFRRRLARGESAELDFEASSTYVTNDEMIPTGLLVPPPAGPWDHCFTGFFETPTIRWPGALTLDLTSTLDHWVIFNRPDDSLCVEPQSGPPNEPNMPDARCAKPGEPVRGSMTWYWTHD